MDFGLTERGIAQARETAEVLAAEGVQRLLASPLKRAWQTAEIIGARLGLESEPEPDLQEYDVGAISGLSAPQIREKFPEIVASWQKGIRPAFPGAEDRDVFHARVHGTLERLRKKDETSVLVTHGGVVISVCYAVLGIDVNRRGLLEAANCGITEVTVDRGGRLVLNRMNDTCHLDGMVTVVDRG
jgi:broad specificity phosphatase PhoE